MRSDVFSKIANSQVLSLQRIKRSRDVLRKKIKCKTRLDARLLLTERYGTARNSRQVSSKGPSVPMHIWQILKLTLFSDLDEKNRPLFRDVGTGGHWGHVPPRFCNKQKVPFWFTKCPFCS